MTTPPHKGGIWGVGFGQNPNSSLNCFSSYRDLTTLDITISDIIQKLFVMVSFSWSILTADPVLLLCLITFKQSFNVFSLNVMRLHYCKLSTIYIYSVIADVRLLLWQRIHSACIHSAAHHRPMVALQCSLHFQLI